MLLLGNKEKYGLESNSCFIRRATLYKSWRLILLQKRTTKAATPPPCPIHMVYGLENYGHAQQ